MVKIHQSAFRLLRGVDVLVEYRFHTGPAQHFFCAVCGIYPIHRKRVAPHHLGINVFCLEGFGPEGIPLRATIGRGMA